MRTRGEGVQKPENFAEVLYVWSLRETPLHNCSDDSVIWDWRFDAVAHFDRNGAIYSGGGGGGEDGTETGVSGKGREAAKRCETKRLRCGREKIAQARVF